MIGLVDPKATPEDGYIYSDGLFDTIDKLAWPSRRASCTTWPNR